MSQKKVNLKDLDFNNIGSWPQQAKIVFCALLSLLIEAARRAGSFRKLEPFDTVFFAKAGEDELRVEAFGCKLKVSSLLDIDPKGGSKSTHKVPFDVTSPDFIRINGVPYLDASEIEGLR